MNNFSDLIGKKYKKNGRGPNAFDCYGVCIEVCKRVGIEIPEMENLLDGKRLFQKVTGSYQAGDLVLMSAGGHHIGVMVDSERLIHTSSEIGSVNRIRKDHPYVQQRVTGVYRYAGGKNDFTKIKTEQH